jgi:hypothetical protein
MNTKYMVVVAAMAVMLIGTTALATDDAFADKKKKSYEKSQAVSQVNYCGNGELPLNIGCQNTASQIQGDENAASLASEQEFEEAE